jgi:hypothetical protein
VESIRYVGLRQWNMVAAPSGLYSSGSWMLTQEGDRTALVRYLLVEDQSGELLAALPIYQVDRETNERYDQVRQDMVSGAESFRVLGSRRGYRSSVLIAPHVHGQLRNAVTATIRSQLAALARSEDCVLYWAFVPDEQLADVIACGGSANPVQVGSEAFLAIPKGGFEEYAAGLPIRRRHNVRGERRRFLEAGYQVAIEPLPKVAFEAAPLLAQLEQKHGSENDVVVYQFYFKRLLEEVDQGYMLTCRYDGRLIGFCLFHSFAGTLWGRAVGFDYPNLRKAFEYFNLGFYELIEHGSRIGAHRVHLGIASLEAKLTHGATTQPLWAVRFETCATHRH